MASIFITGSSDGLGRMAASLLVGRGHTVVLHARNEARARDARAAVPGAEAVLVADLASIAATRRLADMANDLAADLAAKLSPGQPAGRRAFDAVIHNAAVGYKEKRRIETVDGLAHVFAVNTLAPYLLTALMAPPQRLVFVSSELHRRGDAGLDDLQWERRPWRGNQAYSDSKLHDALLAFAVARRRPGTLSNAVEPGWVATKMSGPRATGDLDRGHRTQVWLAGGEPAEGQPAPTSSGGYFFHLGPQKVHGQARDPAVQDKLLARCEQLSGVALAATVPA